VDLNLPRSFLLAGILLLTFAVYAPSLKFAFVHDDRGQIVENVAVQSWRYLPQYFTDQVWAGIYPQTPGNYFRPVFLLWLRLNDMIFGRDPRGWHLTTILLHLATTLLVYFLGRRLLVDEFTAMTSAVVFGLHPAHIESVVWVSGVTEPLLAFFFILAFLCHLKGRESPGQRTLWLALALFFYLVAMFEKETALVFPLLIMAFECIRAGTNAGAPPWTNLVGRGVASLKPAWPYLALTVAYLGARIHALGGFSHQMSPMPFSTVLLTVPSLLAFWIRHLFWPVGLSTFYNYSPVELPTLMNFTLPAIGDILLFLLALLDARKSWVAAFALAWTVLPLLPPMDIRVFAGNDFAHDRYLYLPSVGFAILVALASRSVPARRDLVWGIPASQALALMVVVPFAAFGVVHESSYFANNGTFYEHCWRSAPESILTETNYGAELGEEGRYAESAELLNRVLRREPGNWNAIYNLALSDYHLGRLEEAEGYFTRAIRLSPEVASAHLYLGLVEFKMGRQRQAEASARRAIELDAHGYGYHFALAMMLKQRGNFSAALDELRIELANYPQEIATQQQIAGIEASTRK
jgi:tetratricopeptide (TPR) repeat protein